MDNKTLAKLYSQAVKENDLRRINDYGNQILQIPDFDEEGVDRDLVLYNLFILKTDKIFTLEDKRNRKNVDVAALNELLNEVESLCIFSDKRYHERMVKAYYYVALLNKTNEEGKTATAQIIERALAKGIQYHELELFVGVPSVAKDTKKLINEKIKEHTIEMGHLKAIAELNRLLPNYTFVSQSSAEDTAKEHDYTLSRLLPADRAFCLERFKQYLEKVLAKKPEALEALLASDAKVEMELFYYPAAVNEWEGTVGHYRYKWSNYDGSYSQSGTFDYGGKTGKSVVGLSEEAKSIFEPTVLRLDKQWRNGTAEDKEVVMGNGSYIKPVFGSYTVPDSVFVPVSEAKKWVEKELGKSGVTVTVITKPEYTYDVLAVCYLPAYAIKITNGKYVAKGEINAADTNHVKAEDIAIIENNRVTYLTKKQVKVEKPKKEGKKGKFSFLALINLIFLVLALLLSFGGNELSGLLAPAIILFVLGKIFKNKKGLLIPSLIISILIVLTGLLSGGADAIL